MGLPTSDTKTDRQSVSARLGTGTLEDPIIDNIGYLDNEGKWHQVGGSGGGGDIPTATDAEEGKVLLSDTADESKDAATGGTAATPKAVYDAMKNAVANATDVVIGKVKLTDDYNQDLPAATGVTAVTPNGLKKALDDAKDYVDNISYIVKPVITSPSNEDDDVSVAPTVIATAFKSAFYDDSRQYREFRVATDPDFKNIVASEDVDADQWEVQPPLTQLTRYYVRLRDVASSGYVSPWADTVTFVTSDKFNINTPQVTLHGYANSSTDIGSGVRITSSPFSVTGSSDTHKATSWSIALSSGRGNVWESLNDEEHKTEITVPDGTLSKQTQYKLTVIYHAASGSNSEPAVLDFTTSADFGTVNTPTITVDGEPNDVYETPTLQGGAFSNTRDPDTHQSSEWKIEPAAGGEPVFTKTTPGAVTSTTVEAGKLKTGTAYKAFVRYQGAKYGWSEWGEKQFSTVARFTGVVPPTLSILNCTSDAVTCDAVFVASDLEYIEGEDTCDKADWELMKGDERVWHVENSDRVNAITAFDDYSFEDLTQYTLRYRQHAKDHDDWSSWVELQFTTAENCNESTIQFTMKTKLNLSKIFKWWNASELEVYKDGELQEEWSQDWTQDRTLSTSGNKIKIRNKTKNNYPYVIFNGTEAEYDSLNLGANLISVDAPLPLLRKTDNGDAATDFGGDAGDTCSKGRGMCWKTSYLKSVPSGLFKNNPQIVNFGGMGGGGGGACKYSNDELGAGTAGNGGGSDGKHGVGGDSINRTGRNGLDGHGCFAESGILELPDFLFLGCVNAINFGGWGGGGGGGSCGSGPGTNANSTTNGQKGGSGGLGHGCFYKCSKLIKVPAHIFVDCINAKYFGGVGGGNGGDGGIGYTSAHSVGPGGLGGNATGCFTFCYMLRQIPDDLFAPCINAIFFSGYGSSAYSSGGDGCGCFCMCDLSKPPSRLFGRNTKVTEFDGFHTSKGANGAQYGGGGGGSGWYGGGGGGGASTSAGGIGCNGFKTAGVSGTKVSISGGNGYTIGGGGGGFGGGGEEQGAGGIAIKSTPEPGAYSRGLFDGNKNMLANPDAIDLFKPLSNLIMVVATFANCNRLAVTSFRFSARNIVKVDRFAQSVGGKITVIAPSDSTTAQTFQSNASSNIILQEE